MIKLVIFDFDGTLVDSAEDIMSAANKLLDSYGHSQLTFHQIREHIGAGFSPFIRSVAGSRADDEDFKEQIFQEFQNIYDEELINKTRFYEGFEDFFEEFQKKAVSKIGIVSNKPEYQVRRILKALGVEESHLVEIFGGDRFEHKKPHPFPLQEMMTLAGVEPEETVMIGDSKADVHAAVAAGTHFVGVLFGYNSKEALEGFGAEHFIQHFNELLPLLERLT